MIDQKFAMHYSMPHTLVHIVDNTAIKAQQEIQVADDPSLYSTIVVTGLPIGEDNKVINTLRSDVLNVAYGCANISAEDRLRFGQSVDYPLALNKQGAPVKLMRITPEGSTYAVAPIVIQWRIDPITKIFHARYKQVEIPSEMQLERFASKEKINAALIKQFSNVSVTDNDGTTWRQEIFINYISAGRGKAYNKFSCAINKIDQNKRPANVKYRFITIDTQTDLIPEAFEASLVNIDNKTPQSAISPVNQVIAKRTEGSSVIVPFVNESAIKAAYKDYMNLFKDHNDNDAVVTEYNRKIYAMMNINIFDIIYGEYIYDGASDSETKLPWYQVDMFDSAIPTLPESYRIKSIEPFSVNKPYDLYSKIMPMTYGVTRDNDNCYVGNVYLSAPTNTNTSPMLTVVAAINQFSGAVTSVTIPKIFVKTGENTFDTTPVAIRTVFNDGNASGVGSVTLDALIAQNRLAVGDVVARVSGSTFKLYVVATITPDAVTKYTLGEAYTDGEVRLSIAWGSHTSGVAGTGNIVGRTIDDPAFTRIGATVIDQTDGSVYVNNYDTSIVDGGTFVPSKLNITNAACVFGTCPREVNIQSDIIGVSYDVLAYPRTSISNWKLNTCTLSAAGTGYFAGEKFQLQIPDAEAADGYVLSKTVFTIDEVGDEVGSEGAIISFSRDDTLSTPETLDLTSDTPYEIKVIGDSSIGTLATVTVAVSDMEAAVAPTGDPSSVERYVITGVVGSLFMISKDSTEIPANYYSSEYGINLNSEFGGVKLGYGSTGFFDDETISTIEFKWRYSALLVKAFRGQIDARIMSTARVPAKFLFDGGFNTIVGISMLPNMQYQPSDVISNSTIFTADEKDAITYDPSLIANITFDDIDVKQAMYDFMDYRLYQGMPEAKRGVGPGYGLSLYLDSCDTDTQTTELMRESFAKRFTNPNGTWDVGGIVDPDGNRRTCTWRLASGLIEHCKTQGINKPFVKEFSQITKDEYIDYFPDIDPTQWEKRNDMYNAGANLWITNVDGTLMRQSQRTFERSSETSDLVQESNMRTLSQLLYLITNDLDKVLLDYDDDGVLKTISDRLNKKFSGWVGTYVQSLEIQFKRDKNPDGTDILVAAVDVSFRGLILRIDLICNVNNR